MRAKTHRRRFYDANSMRTSDTYLTREAADAAAVQWIDAECKKA